MNKLHDVNLDGIGNINGGNYRNIKITGVGTILNDVTCESIILDGVSKATGNINCRDAAIEGTFNCKGSIEANDVIKINGYSKIDKNIQGREVNIDGKLEVKGLLSGDKINILFLGRNKIKEIGGEEIIILQEKKSLVTGFIVPNKLISDSIEGDIIILENTDCNIVRGKKVTIKGVCKIGKIEYEEEIHIDEKSNVESIVKI